MYHPLDPEQHAEPWEEMAAARKECPVARFAPGNSYVAGYDDAVGALLDARRLSSKDNFLTQPLPDGIPPFVTQLDPPGHTPVRRLLRGLFTRSRVAANLPMMQEAARELLDAAEAADPRELDVAAFARAYTSRVLYSMIGVPVEDWDQVNALVFLLFDAFPGPYWEHEAFRGWEEYFAGLADVRRERRGDDLISLMISDGAYSDREISQHIMQLVVAGFETTASLIANLVHQLLLEPDRWARLRAEPGLLRGAIEESLRHLSPISWVSRTALPGAEVGGVPLPAGETATICLESANRDETVFDDPDEFVLDRPNASKHIAFGAGAHRCLGDVLALQEAEVALTELLARYAEPQLVDHSYVPLPLVLVRSPLRMPVRLP